MSNEVYFNEPGYEHLMGTDQGEKLNNGYANIVRYGTLKYAIIEQLRSPTPGFEDIIRRNFFLKKDMILAEVDGWIEREKTEDANYTDGLTTSHNPDIAAMLGESGAYRKKLIELRKELVAEFAKLDSPYLDSSSDARKIIPVPKASSNDSNTAVSDPSKVEKFKHYLLDKAKAAFALSSSVKDSKKGEEDKDTASLKLDDGKADSGPSEAPAAVGSAGVLEAAEQQEVIDVSYTVPDEDEESKSAQQKTINVDDESVKDRWSRYIGAMGIEAVAKQAEAVVYIDQLGGLGIEIAKNIMLAGCKELILGPTGAPDYADLASQFFIDEKDVRESTKRGRATLCKQKLQELNPYVRVTLIDEAEFAKESFLIDRQVRIAVFTDALKHGKKNAELVRLNERLRASGIYTILADQSGVFSRIITDFGQSHTVIDKDGEDI